MAEKVSFLHNMKVADEYFRISQNFIRRINIYFDYSTLDYLKEGKS